MPDQVKCQFCQRVIHPPNDTAKHWWWDISGTGRFLSMHCHHSPDGWHHPGEYETDDIAKLRDLAQGFIERGEDDYCWEYHGTEEPLVGLYRAMTRPTKTLAMITELLELRSKVCQLK